MNDVEVRESASHLCNDRLYGEDEVAAAFIEKNFTLLLLALSRRDILFQLFSQVRLEIVRFRVVPVVLPLRHVFFFLVFSRPLCGSRKNMGGERERERERSFGHSLAERARERKATRHRKSFQKRLSRRLILLFFDDDEIQFSPMTKKTNGTHLLLRTPRTRRRTLSPPALSSSVCSRGVVVVSLGVGRFWSEEAS